MNTDISAMRFAVDTLRDSCSLEVYPHFLERVAAYMDLIREWNDYAGLVSPGDAANDLEGHVVDSLGLLPYVAPLVSSDGYYLDIGSGGGFPAIPLKLAWPDIPLLLVERRAKKCAFLTKVIGVLELDNVTVHCDSFESIRVPERVVCATARAVERPAEVIPQVLRALHSGGVLLMQSSTAMAEIDSEASIEEVSDVWSGLGLRRGRLYLVRPEL